MNWTTAMDIAAYLSRKVWQTRRREWRAMPDYRDRFTWHHDGWRPARYV